MKAKKQVPDVFEITPLPGERPSQMFARFQVDWLRTRFEDDANPIYAWEAYRICYESESPVPDWVADYLYKAGSAIARGEPAVMALGLAVKGGHPKVQQAHAEVRDVHLAARVAYLSALSADDVPPDDLASCKFPMTIDKIFDHVANEHHVSKETVRRAYYAYAK